MAIVVVGGGAIGLIVAGGLASSGQVVGLLARASTRRALASEPLRIERGAQVTTVIDLPVAETAAELSPALRRPDLAILCVKGYDTPAAIETLAALAPRTVLTLQNGIGNEELLAARFGASNVLAGAIMSSAEPVSPSRVQVTKVGGVGIAPVGPGLDPAPWVAALGRAGFESRGYDNYRSLKWSKALLNMLGNATAAILGVGAHEVYADDRLVALERRASLEALATMARLGARPLNLPGYPAATLALAMRLLPAPLLYPLLRSRVGGGRGGKDPSLLRDLRAGRGRSEGEFIYGAIAAEAQRQGLAAPVNAGLWRVLEAIVTGAEPWERYKGRPDVLLAAVGGG